MAAALLNVYLVWGHVRKVLHGHVVTSQNNAPRYVPMQKARCLLW